MRSAKGKNQIEDGRSERSGLHRVVRESSLSKNPEGKEGLSQAQSGEGVVRTQAERTASTESLKRGHTWHVQEQQGGQRG